MICLVGGCTNKRVRMTWRLKLFPCLSPENLQDTGGLAGSKASWTVEILVLYVCVDGVFGLACVTQTYL